MRSVWIFTKFIWLYIAYWFVGSTPDYFYISKGNYFLELRWYERAIRNYKKALEDSTDHRIHDVISYCYSQMGRSSDAIDYYRAAYEKNTDPRTAYGLARAELERGNLEKSQEIIEAIRRINHHIDQLRLDALEAEIQVVKKAREDASHMAHEFQKRRG